MGSIYDGCLPSKWIQSMEANTIWLAKWTVYMFVSWFEHYTNKIK